MPGFDEDLLRWTAEAAEQALRARLRLQQELDTSESLDAAAAATLRQQMEAHAQEERRLSRAVAHLTRQHPAWSWLETYGSVNPMVAGKLLARLDIHEAPDPECFWRQCDLLVVRAVEYLCDRCPRTVTIQTGRAFDTQHRDFRTGEPCQGRLRASTGSRRRVLIARPRAEPEPAVDPLAKRYLYLTVNALVQEEPLYAELHQRERDTIHRDRPTWHAKRKHFGALRKVKKRFLLELWVAWRRALGMPTDTPNVKVASGGTDPHTDLRSRAVG